MKNNFIKMEDTMKNKKKKTGYIIFMLISIFLFSGSISVYSQSCGDVNNSGTIDIVDALLTAQYYVGLNPANFDSNNADVNCNGTIDIVDALLIAQYYVDLVAGFCL